MFRIRDILVPYRFYAYSFLKVHLHHSSKTKSHKDVTKSRNQGFSSFFCLLMEGSGSVKINYGSGCGSRSPKIIRIRNTAFTKHIFYAVGYLNLLESIEGGVRVVADTCICRFSASNYCIRWTGAAGSL
jgi:hypothetical protein